MKTIAVDRKPSTVTVIKTHNCGCGWRSEHEREACDHAAYYGHSITIHGMILAERDHTEAT